MPSLRILTCAKPAESYRKSRLFAVDAYPQTAYMATAKLTQHVQNHTVLPAFHLSPTHDYPQPKTTVWHLFVGVFSPPSTGPITITTT